MLTIGTLAKVAAQIYGCNLEDLLSYCEHADGSVVIIAPTGQKYAYSADEIMAKVLESTQPSPDVATEPDDIAFEVVAKPDGFEPNPDPDLAPGSEMPAADSVTEDMAVAEKAPVAKKKTRTVGNKKPPALKDDISSGEDTPS